MEAAATANCFENLGVGGGGVAEAGAERAPSEEIQPLGDVEGVAAQDLEDDVFGKGNGGGVASISVEVPRSSGLR